MDAHAMAAGKRRLMRANFEPPTGFVQCERIQRVSGAHRRQNSRTPRAMSTTVLRSPLRILPVVVALAAALFLGACATPPPVDPALRDPAKNSAIRPEPREGGW